MKHLLFMRRQIHATYDHLLSVAMPPVKRIVNLRGHDACIGLQHPAWLCVLIRCELMTATPSNCRALAAWAMMPESAAAMCRQALRMQLELRQWSWTHLHSCHQQTPRR